MDKDLKQVSCANSYSRSSKRIAALSFLAALQLSSCIGGSGQGFRNSSGDIDILSFPEGSPEFKKLQAKTADTVLQNHAEREAKLHKTPVLGNFLKAVIKCDLPSVKSLLKDPFITSKVIVKGLMEALNYKDTLSFRYKHEKIVHFLLEEFLKRCKSSSEDLSLLYQEGKNLLHLLIRRGDIHGVQRLTDNLSLGYLCATDKKGRSPIFLAACYKSKKMFGILFGRIYKLDPARAIDELFKKDAKGYSVIESSYLPKDRNFAAFFNNSHIQLPTFCRKGSEMFKHVLKTLPICLGCEQLVTIAIGLEEIVEGKIISEGYAATLRSILTCYIKQQYGSDSKEVIRYVAYKRNLAYIEQQYGSDSKEVEAYKGKHKHLVAYIEQQYGSKFKASVRSLDEGYVSA